MTEVNIDVEHLWNIADELLASIPEGAPLTEFETAMIELGVAVSVTSLSRNFIDLAILKAFSVGSTAEQIQEVVSLISGLGVHSLMLTSATILARSKDGADRPPFTERQQELWDKYVGEDSFWDGFEVYFPDFLESMLRLSPDQFIAFFDYCAVPWKSGTVRAVLKELIAMASDATPTHRFVPGFQMHLVNAIKLGAGRAAISQALNIAAAAPPHKGTR